jgi:outer membrane immunogenic protein
MKRALLGLAGLVALGAAAPAGAADLPVYTKTPAMVAAIYDWSGFYVGVNGGGGSAHKCWDITQFGPTEQFSPAISEGCHSATGGLAGGQVGFRWQSANFVFGVEGQGDWASLRGSNTSQFIPGATNESRVNGIGLVTGQVGYAWNNVLWYVKGGAAVSGDGYRGITTSTGLLVDNAVETRWGGAIGTGLEFGFAPNWSVGVEYDHLFMGSRTVTFPSVATGHLNRIDNIKQDVDMGTLRVNYRWGGPVIGKY